MLIVSHREWRITVVERIEGGRWTERELRDGEMVTLDAFDAAFPVSAVYDGVALDPA